jgi:hypothetical protein
MTPIREYKIFNVAETVPENNPSIGFMYLFPKNGQWWQRNPSGEDKVLTPVDFNETANLPWVSTETYTLDNGDVYVLHNDRLWKLVAATSTNNEPGNSQQWDEVSFSNLQHPQNTDMKLGRHTVLLDGGGTKTFDLTTTLYEGNYYILDTDAGGGNATYTLRTRNGSSRKQGRFLCLMPLGVAYTITFQDSTIQKIGTENLVLSAGDWAEFEGDVNGKTTLIASNKLPGNGGSENPFDQSLNKANDVTFNSVKITGLAGATPAVATVAVDGQLEKKNIVNLADYPLETLSWQDTVDGNIYQMRITNGQIEIILI